MSSNRLTDVFAIGAIGISGLHPTSSRKVDEPIQSGGIAQTVSARDLLDGAPISIRFTGTSSALPLSVRGTSPICTTSSGIWRGEQSDRTLFRNRITS